jgi:Na+/H+ antiporter NhaD/arsenite permease-like protein
VLADLPFEFVLFGATLVGVAVLHHHTLRVAVGGLCAILAYKWAFVDTFDFLHHLGEEAVGLSNLLGLLLGFAVLANHFEASRIPAVLPRFLPDDWRGGFVLLALVFLLSAFLDNIAAAIIGGTVAGGVFKRVHIGYLAAIVACANAGGAGSVVGDTTTTMMWMGGVSPLQVAPAYIGAAAAGLVCATIASVQQHRFQPITKDPEGDVRVDGGRVAIVGAILAAAVAANVVTNLAFPELVDRFPFIAAAIWVVILVASCLRTTAWHLLPEALRGSVFLLSLVLCASMMPVERLPAASASAVFGLGLLSAVFDNIPLTALALKQGGYDWGFLAYAIGYGGSMVWFGSSAGVALSNRFPEARSAAAYVRNGWHVALGYAVGCGALWVLWGWHPS